MNMKQNKKHVFDKCQIVVLLFTLTFLAVATLNSNRNTTIIIFFFLNYNTNVIIIFPKIQRKRAAVFSATKLSLGIYLCI